MLNITKEDYGFDKEKGWNAYWKSPAKNDYYRAKKLTDNQIDKFDILNKMLGWECDFIYRNKKRKAVIIAVSLPGQSTTVYPTGEINEHYKKEHAIMLNSYPYWFRIAIEGCMDFWTNKIDNINLENSKFVGFYFNAREVKDPIKFKNIDEARKIYM